MPARRGLLLLSADRWQVLTRYQQYRPGAPAEGSASPPVQGQPGEISNTSHARRLVIWHRSAGQLSGRGGRRGTIGGYRRISFRAFAR